MSKIQKQIQCLCDRINALEAREDLDEQTISLLGNILSISNGNSVDLSQFLDNTDDQIISASVV